MEYCLAVKRNKLIHAIAWMNFKNLQNRKSQTVNYMFSHLCKVFRKGKGIETESKSEE